MAASRDKGRGLVDQTHFSATLSRRLDGSVLAPGQPGQVRGQAIGYAEFHEPNARDPTARAKSCRDVNRENFGPHVSLEIVRGGKATESVRAGEHQRLSAFIEQNGDGLT